ncbi:MAG: hypothetical protein IKW92_00780 [Firmicutes bacterium]|nr:hypothetical protein [Bacillota bacterium]
MFAITLNTKRNEIVVTKKFAEAAKHFGSEEYKMLKEAKMDNPSFKVVTRKVKASKNDKMKGLTYKFMEKYISTHDDEEGTLLATFKELTAKSEEAMELNAAACSYQEVKDWFLNTFPAIATFSEKQNAILENAKKKAAQVSNVVEFQKNEEVSTAA